MLNNFKKLILNYLKQLLKLMKKKKNFKQNYKKDQVKKVKNLNLKKKTMKKR